MGIYTGLYIASRFQTGRRGGNTSNVDPIVAIPKKKIPVVVSEMDLPLLLVRQHHLQAWYHRLYQKQIQDEQNQLVSLVVYSEDQNGVGLHRHHHHQDTNGRRKRTKRKVIGGIKEQVRFAFFQ